MRKIAKYDSPAWLLLPGHRLLGQNPDLRNLPKIFSDDAANNTAWSTLGAVTSAGILSALLTKLVNKKAKKHLEDKQKEVHANKIDALYASAEADKAGDVKKTASSASAATTILPLTAAALTGYGVHKLVSKNVDREYAAELDARIAKQRAKLQKLYEQLEHLYGSGDNQTITKQASSPSITGRSLLLAYLGLLSMAGVGAAGGYYYTKKHSDEYAMQKVLEEQMLADNLTNIPDNVAMQLDPRGKK